MTFLYIFIAFVLWWFIWYWAFYFSYKDRKNVEELKSTLLIKSEENERLSKEHEEISQENDFLREEAQRLDSENKNYKEIVAKLQWNNHLIDKLKALIKESANLLWVYDKEVEYEVKKVIWAQVTKKTEVEDDDEWNNAPKRKYF